MIADLKARFEGIDKKRIYTAIAALVIAGAAGHFMQRTATAPGGSGQVLSASVPGSGEVTMPSEAPKTVAAGMIAAASVPLETASDDALKPDQLAGTAIPGTAEPGVEESPTEIEVDVAEANPVDPIIEPLEIAPEVTRAASKPLLAAVDAQSAPLSIEPEATPAVAQAPSLEAETATPVEELTLAAADDQIELSIEPTVPVTGCAITFDAVAQDGALAAISLDAPCNAGEDVDFEHEGLLFSEQLGPNGDLFLLAPAMAEDAIFRVRFADGQEAAIEVTLPDFDDYERLALVWRGPTGLQLHVLENGADYGGAGHVWAETPKSPEAALIGEGGFLSVLGSTSAGYAADVYTYPVSLFADGPEPAVSVEAEVMENTCATEIQGRILRSNAGRAPTSQPLTIAVPGCDAVGEYLVLNNLPQDLKLARN